MNSKLVARTAAAAVLTLTAAFTVSCTPSGAPGHVAVSEVSPPSTMKVPGIGTVALDGVIAQKYKQAGGESGLGLPTGPPKKVGDGTIQAFAKGAIYSAPGTGTHALSGEVLNTYLAHGGPRGPLGFPKSDVFEVKGGPRVVHGGWGAEFEHGSVYWLNRGDDQFAGYVTMKN